MKKLYMQPAFNVIELNVSCQMLAGSTDYNASDVTLGGSADNGSAYARGGFSFSFDDEEEEE